MYPPPPRSVAYQSLHDQQTLLLLFQLYGQGFLYFSLQQDRNISWGLYYRAGHFLLCESPSTLPKRCKCSKIISNSLFPIGSYKLD